MAVQAGQYGVRAVPREAGDSAWGVRDAGFTRRTHRLLLQSDMAALGLPSGDVLAHCAAVLLHNLCFCGDQQGGR